MKCPRHKETDLQNGVCPECGFTQNPIVVAPVASKPFSIGVTTVPVIVSVNKKGKKKGKK